MIGDRESEYQSFFGAALTVNPLEIGLWVWPNVLACKKDPYQINRPILIGEIVQNNHKIVFYAFWGILAPPNGPKRYKKACI